MISGKRTLFLMGTVIELWVNHSQSQLLLDQAEARLIDFEKRFSANDANSDLMMINQQAGIKSVIVQEDLFELISLGKKQSLMKDTFLNIAIGPLIQEWRIGFNDAKHPTESRINQLLTIIEPEKIILDKGKSAVYLEKKGMALDLGALAKGYFADQIISFFKSQQAKAGFIDLGGNVVTFGESPTYDDGKWRIAIQNPFLPRGNYGAVIKVKNQSVVTSGVYERMFEWQGETYHHIFDSQTGYPIKSELASLTIVSDDSLTGEIWTTSLFGKGAVAIIRELRAEKGLNGLVITNEGQLAYTEGLSVEF